MSEWPMVRLIDVCDFQGGSQPPKDQWINEPRDKYIRMLQIRDFTQERDGKEEYIKTSNSIKTCNSDDILIARYGASVGKILTGLSGAYNVAIIKTLPDTGKLSKPYLRKYLESAIFQNYILNVGARAAQAGFNKDDLRQLFLPLPPLDVQRRIADILDRASALIEKRKAQIEKLDLLVKSRFVEMFGDPVTNPKRWEKKPFGKTCDIITGNTPPRENAEYYGDFLEWIKTDNIQESDSALTQAKEMLSERGFEKCRYVEAGSILMTCIAGSLNSIGNVAITNRKVSFNQQINALTPKQYDSTFLYALLRAMKKEIHESVNMMLKGILSKGTLSKIEAIVPPLALQTQFAVFVERVESQKATMRQGLELMELNYKALMQKCFTGEIVYE